MALLKRIHVTSIHRGVMRVTCMLLAAVLLSATPRAGAQQVSIDDLKAAFVFQFANFAEWPASAFDSDTAPIVIGIVGNDAMATTLAGSVKDKKVGQRSIEIKNITSPDQTASCQILFLDSSDDKRVDEYLAAVSDKPILTVSDDNNFTEEGGIIKLFEKQGKLRIEINIDSAERARVSISSKLLNLATVVHDKT